jgi:hypothetical protein
MAELHELAERTRIGCVDQDDYYSMITQLSETTGKDQFKTRSIAQGIYLVLSKKGLNSNIPWNLLPKELREQQSLDSWIDKPVSERKSVFLESKMIQTRLKRMKPLFRINSVPEDLQSEFRCIINFEGSPNPIPLIQSSELTSQLLNEWRAVEDGELTFLTGHCDSDYLYNDEGHLSGLWQDEQPWGLFQLRWSGRKSSSEDDARVEPRRKCYAFVEGRFGRSCSGCGAPRGFFDELFIHESLDVLLRYALSEEQRRQIGLRLK